MRKKVLLIVEDFDFIRNLIGRYFQMQGYEVISAGNIHEAAAIGEHEQPRIIITDFDMSNDPYVVVSILHNILPDSRIVMIDGRNRKCDSEEAMKSGVSDILGRVFSATLLENILHGKSEKVQA